MNAYFKVISRIERLHRQFLELVKLELDGLGIHDINNVQGMMLFSIGDAEMTVLLSIAASGAAIATSLIRSPFEAGCSSILFSAPDFWSPFI